MVEVELDKIELEFVLRALFLSHGLFIFLEDIGKRHEISKLINKFEEAMKS